MKIYLFATTSLFIMFLVTVISYKRMRRNDISVKATLLEYQNTIVIASITAACASVFFSSVWLVANIQYSPDVNMAKLEEQFYSGVASKVAKQKKILSALNIELKSSRSEYANLKKWNKDLEKQHRELLAKVEKPTKDTVTLKEQWEGCEELPTLYITKIKYYTFSSHECWRFYVKKVEHGYIGVWWNTQNRKITDYYELRTGRILNKDYYSDSDYHEELLFLFSAPMKNVYDK